jgi:hypothetical protein
MSLIWDTRSVRGGGNEDDIEIARADKRRLEKARADKSRQEQTRTDKQGMSYQRFW